MVELFKVLADESRLRIINLLRHQELCVCEIEAILGTSQSNVSRHLTRLRQAGLVAFDKRAQWTYYRIHPDFLARYPLLFQSLHETMEQSAVYQTDLAQLAEYRAAGLTCERPNPTPEGKQ